MAMPPRCDVTAAAKMPKRAGYSALDDRRAAMFVQGRPKMFFSQILDLAISLRDKKIFKLIRECRASSRSPSVTVLSDASLKTKQRDQAAGVITFLRNCQQKT
jgi:hypothetical protein